MRTNFLGRVVMLVAVTLSFLSAGQRAAVAGTNVACFKVLNASPDAPSLNVYVNRTLVAANLAYTKFGRRWCYPATQALVRAFAVGTPATAAPLVQGTIALQIDTGYLIAITGYAQQPPPPQQQISVTLLEDPLPPQAGYFSLRLANLAPNVPLVNLIRIQPNQPLLENVAFPTAKVGDFLPGSYNLILQQPNSTTPLANLGMINFAAGQKQTIYVFAAPGTSAAAVRTDAAGAPLPPAVTPLIIQE